MTKAVKMTVEPPDRATTWVWSGRPPPGYPTETNREQDETAFDYPKTEAVEQ